MRETMSEEEREKHRVADRLYREKRGLRKHPVRPAHENIERMPLFRRLELYKEGETLTTDEYDPRPATRAGCEGGERPCPYVSCKYHLYLDVAATGNIKLNFPDIGPEHMRVSCVLDVAAVGGVTLEEAGEFMNLTRERARQLEAMGNKSLKARMKARGIRPGDAMWSSPESMGERLEQSDTGGGAEAEPDFDIEDLEIIRWANEVYAEMKHVGLRRALALANESTENLGEEDHPL